MGPQNEMIFFFTFIYTRHQFEIATYKRNSSGGGGGRGGGGIGGGGGRGRGRQGGGGGRGGGGGVGPQKEFFFNSTVFGIFV